MPFIYELTKPNAFLLYKTCIFEMKPIFFFIVTKKMARQFTFLSKTILLNLCNKIN